MSDAPGSGSHSRRAAVIASPKTAALYYDRILPIPGRPEHIAQALALLELPETRTKLLLMEEASACREILDAINRRLHDLSEEQLQRAFGRKGVPPFSDLGECAMYYAASECLHVGEMELILSEIPAASSIHSLGKNKKKSSKQSVMVTLVNLDLVDAEQAPWEQILDFRSDKKATIAFAQLRDFLFTSCVNCSHAELQDRIAKLLYEYELKSKEHGFKSKAAACEILLNSQTLVKLASAGILGTFLAKGWAGVSPAIAAGGVTGAAIVFDCARAAIASRRALFERDSVLETHPANWVFMARKAVQPYVPSEVEPIKNLSLFGKIWSRISK